MIYINETLVDLNTISNEYQPDSVEQLTLNKLSDSNYSYQYSTQSQLKFELELRRNIVDAAIALYKSGLTFKTFRNSMCNPYYWKRTNEGGFLNKPDISQYDAISDIYNNGYKYGTECATAIPIVYYGALTKTYSNELFNKVFENIYLMDWQNLNPNLGVRSYNNVPDQLPGDCLYFKNPDVDPLTPQWQGENVIDFGDGLYYGHGIGIRTAEVIIITLNKYRIDGSQTSAYLLNSATRPDFEKLDKLKV